jgi:hypothetical protein
MVQHHLIQVHQLHTLVVAVEVLAVQVRRQVVLVVAELAEILVQIMDKVELQILAAVVGQVQHQVQAAQVL